MAQAKPKQSDAESKRGWRPKSLMERLAEFEKRRTEAEKKKQTT